MIRRRSGTRQVDWGDPAPQQQDHRVAVRVPALGEAGPSNYASRWMDSAVTPSQEIEEEDAIGAPEGAPSRRTARRRACRSPRSAMTLVPACLASLLPTTAAAPPGKRRDSRRSPPSQPLPPPKLLPTPTTPPVRRDNAPHYLDPYLEPSTLPSVRHLVEENRLPYVLTQGDDGQWSKVDYGWSIFGRQAGPTNAVLVNNAGETVASVPSSTWAVEENLPTGWGQSSNRTDFYKVPLIAVASVILAIGLVTIIFIIAFKRRKAVRRAKRRAERQRRKALAAAGLTENDINESNANAAMAEKLQALEEKHRNGKRRKFGSTALVRTKVKNWNQGLRRRKGRKADADQDGVGHMEVVHEDTGDEDQDKPVEPATGPQVLNHDRSSEDSAGSATDPPSESSGSRSGSHNDSSPTTSTSSGEALQPAPEDDTTPTAYFPPAYRPASVRSMRLTNSAGSSSLSSSMHDGPPPTALEKTNAPGYYPAPTTADTEEALAVVSRSQGKSRAIVDEEEEARAERMRHVATDDKRVLEQLRLGASAPSAPPSADVNEAGPSAPMFDVDEHGFERITLEEAGPSAPPEPVDSPQTSSPPGSLPAPPRRVLQRSLRPTTDVDEQLSRDVAMVIPSAPPILETDYAIPGDQVGSAPSAPPMLDDEDADVQEDTASTVPSAPPLAPDEDEDADESASHAARTSTESRRASPVGSTRSTRTASHAHDPIGAEGGAGDEDVEDVELQRTQRESSRSSAHPGVVFLPRYEP